MNHGCSEKEAKITNPLLWSAEIPNLYTAILCLKDNQEKVTEALSSKIGFRKIEIKNKHVYINNKQVFFKGVNRHEMHPRYGKETMIRDVVLMKQHNINTVKCRLYNKICYFCQWNNRCGCRIFQICE